MQAARRVEFEVGAPGYAPRKVTGEFSRPGEYVVRVQLRTWREELFERARPWLRRARPSAGAMPTLREALGDAGRDARARWPSSSTWRQGCYAPESPDATVVERAEELSAVVDPPA